MMVSMTSAFDAWKQRAADAAIDEVAARLGARLRRVTKWERAGPCPICRDGDDRFSLNLKKQIFNCRICSNKGDVITLVQKASDLDFIAACEWILGEPPPDRKSRLTDEDRERFEREAAARTAQKAQQQAVDNEFRERERGTLYDIWRRADPDAPELADYLALRLGTAAASRVGRGVAAENRPRLRLVRDMPYYRQGGDRGEILAHAPAMVAPLVDAAGKFRGLHFTYLDLTAKGKLRVADPGKPGALLPAKKVRGSKQGFWIDLFPRGLSPPPLRGRSASEASREGGHSSSPLIGPRHLVLGEGIEKVLAVWLALLLAGRDLSAWAFWVASDLGNIGGKSAVSIRHPTLKHASGRPMRVAGPDPDLTAPAIVIPDSVDDLILLGDSTSERVVTECTLARATRRYARDGRTVRVAWAPDSVDFDEILLREAA